MSTATQEHLYSIGTGMIANETDGFEAVSDRSEWVRQYLDWGSGGVWAEFDSHDPGRESARLKQLTKQI